jgi:hypothetical protein
MSEENVELVRQFTSAGNAMSRCASWSPPISSTSIPAMRSSGARGDVVVVLGRYTASGGVSGIELEGDHLEAAGIEGGG